MKKVLIISYFFPPGNFAGSYRIKAWAEHLHKFGYFPIVVTRHWLENETDYTAISAEQEIKREEFGHYTVFRLPYKGSFRDRLVKRFGPKAIPLGKFFSFFQVIGGNYFLRSIPYRNIYNFSRKLLKENPDIKLVLTSGRPFIHFRFAYLLKKEFPNIEWVADYRDPWNSCSNIKSSAKLKFLKRLETPLEKKWLKNCVFFTTVSEGFQDSIQKIIRDKKGYVILNGFEDFFDCREKPDYQQEIVISYVGTLYYQQRIEVFLEGFKKFIRSHPHSKIKLIFWGLGNDKNQVARIKNTLIQFEDYFQIFPWVEKEKLKVKLCLSDCFLVAGIPERKGTLTAKIFDYFSLRKPIVLCPTDQDIIERVITETHTGVVLKNSHEVYYWLAETYKIWLESAKIPYLAESSDLEEFRYENQVFKLTNLLKQIPK
jgi:glycosyltransferase involved in cell wall biosynthesis